MEDSDTPDLQDSSPETSDHPLSDSWEKLQTGEISDLKTRHNRDHSTTSSPELVETSSSVEKISSSLYSKGCTSDSDSEFEKARDIEMSKKGDIGGYQDTTPTGPPQKMTFDPKMELENRIMKPLQKIFYRKKKVNEKSSLVKYDVEEYEEEVIMPELPDPSSAYFKRDCEDLPAGIGTGDVENSFGYSKLNDDSNVHASTYADAAKGLLMSFLGAGVMYGLTAVLVRVAGEEGIDPVAVMFIRSVFQAFVFGATLLCTKRGWKPPPGRVVRCIWISVAYCIASISSYEAFDVIPPGSAVATRGAARTIFSIIFAYLVLREGVSIGDILGLLCCFGGIALIITSGMTSGDKDYIQPPGMKDNATLIRIYGYALLVVSAIGRSLGHVGVRGAKEDLSTFTVVFYHSSLTVLAAGILLATVRQPTAMPSWEGVACVAGICVASSIATYTSNQAVKYAHPALVSFGQNADVVVSLTLEHIMIDRSPRPMELSGVLTIFFGLCGLTLYKWLQSKRLQSQHEILQ